MNKELPIKAEDNPLLRFVNLTISFIVGLSAFFIFKLILMIPLNIVITPENADLIESIGTLFLLLSIYLAFKFSSNLNKNGTRKSRNIKRIVTIFLGIICMVGTTVFISIADTNKSMKTVSPKNKNSPVITATVIESANGVTEEQLDQDALKRLENWQKKEFLARLQSDYESKGYDFSRFDTNSFIIDSIYIIVHDKKLAVIRMNVKNILNYVSISGIKGDEFISIYCMRMNNIEVSFTKGKCLKEVQKSFEFALIPQI